MTAPSAPLELDNALWRFVLPFYARDGVSPACLTLQDKLGVDVNVLLLAIFAQVERGVTLDEGDLATADRLVQDWRAEVIQPLRRVRIRLKAGPAPAPSEASENLRNRIKAAELEGEQVALAVLAAWLDAQPAREADPLTEKNIALAVARHFHAGAFAPEVEAALATLSQAVREARGKHQH
jgi:uncharacterized protein (TIGR02444 family)